VGDDEMTREELVREVERLRARLAALSAGGGGGNDVAYHDAVTGLYNRGAFFTLALQQFRLASRKSRPMLLLMCDVKGLAGINESAGREAGDDVLARVGRLLKQTYREADIVARVGADEFAVLALEAAAAHENLLASRLRRQLAEIRQESGGRDELSVRVGVARWDPAEPCTVKELLDQAENNMRVDNGL
jgi:two-component system cell cycle response regulator